MKRGTRDERKIEDGRMESDDGVKEKPK